jgi:hypothetical protein
MSDQTVLTGTLIDGEISSDDQSTGSSQQLLITPSSYQERIILPTKKNTS